MLILLLLLLYSILGVPWPVKLVIISRKVFVTVLFLCELSCAPRNVTRGAAVRRRSPTAVNSISAVCIHKRFVGSVPEQERSFTV